VNFTTFEFAGLLLTTLAVFYFLPQRARMLLLLVASYVFYCFWEPWYGVLIFGSTSLAYAMALVIERSETPRVRRAALIASLVGNLGVLAWFKYTDFALDSLRVLLGPLGAQLPGPLEIVLPVGISFYTFQTASYTIDVYRGKYHAQKDFLLVALYVAFFAQLVAGPIERARDLMPQLQRRQAFDWTNIEAGLALILWGLIKKLVISDRLMLALYGAFSRPQDYSGPELILSALGMSMVLYLDFSAYSEIARGTARLFGVRLHVNFGFPMAAGNPSAFWNRWHITLSNWVRDYLFEPLGGFQPRRFWFSARNTLLTMGLVGLWHGAQWTFVLWGLTWGAVVLAYHQLRIRVLRRKSIKQLRHTLAWRLGGWSFMVGFRAFMAVLFFAASFTVARLYFDRVLDQANFPAAWPPHVWTGLGILAFVFAVHYVHSRLQDTPVVGRAHPLLRGALYAAGVMVVLFGAIDTGADFIYFRF